MKIEIISSILREYGISWVLNRSLYSIKLKIMCVAPGVESIFEKKVSYPSRIDIFELDIKSIKRFIKLLPDEKKQELILCAEEACKGKVLGFSSIPLDYGLPINWNLNPMTQNTCDIKKKWYLIPDFDKKRGDIKAIWEISRFSHFITLSRAYLLTGERRFYEAFSKQLSDWLKKNPYSYGANFKCGQECSFRMINVLIAYSVYHFCGLTTEEDENNVKSLILRCYRKILSNFFYAQKCIKNNHTISELTGMIIGAWCCGDKMQLTYAFRILDKVIDEQFSDDGGYKQFSFNYQRLALQDLEVVLSIERKVHYELNANSKKKMLNAVKLMYQCQDISGDMPNYGSNDGALIFPVTSCSYRDFRPVINAVYTILTGKSLYEEGIYDEELLWFRQTEKRIYRKENVQRKDSEFKHAGLFTFRSEDIDAWIMLILNDYHSRPAHMDQLHMDLWIDGINVFCDSGTYSYASELGRKMIFNENHNTLVLKKKTQMNLYGSFLVYNWIKRTKVRKTGDFFCGEYKSGNGYQHKRTVKKTHLGFHIEDEVKGEKGNKFEILFHTPCKIIEQETGGLSLYKGDRRLCTMKLSLPYKIKKAKRSLYYLQEKEMSCIAACGILENRMQFVQTEIIIKGELEVNG